MSTNYADVRVEEHEKQLEEYTRIVDYTNKVLDSITDVHNISENNVYDLIYAKKLLSDAKDITDVGVEKAVKDTLNRISLIIDIVKDEDITDSIDKKQYDIIDSSKYSKGYALKSLEDYSKPKYKTMPAMEIYLKAEIPRVLEITMVIAVILVMPFVINTLLPSVNDASQPEVFKSTYNALQAFIRLLLMLLIMVKSFGIVLDTAYLTLPAARESLERIFGDKVDSGIKTFISGEALKALSMDGTKHFIGYEESQKYNRLSLAETMYNNMKNDPIFSEVRKGSLNYLAVKPKSKKANIERLVEVERLYDYYTEWRK